MQVKLLKSLLPPPRMWKTLLSPKNVPKIKLSITYFPFTLDLVSELQYSWVAAKTLKMFAFDWCEKTFLKAHKYWGIKPRKASPCSAAEVWLALLLQFLNTYQHSINIHDMILVTVNTY